MLIFNKLRIDRKLLLIVVCLVLAVFLLPYLTIPGVILWWFYKKSKFSKRFKLISTSVVFGSIALLSTMGFIAYAKDAPPHLSITQPGSLTTNIKAQQIIIKGVYSPSDRKVWINSQEISASNGRFETVYKLKEGMNKINVETGDWKRVDVYLTVTRELTDEEKAARITPMPTSYITTKPTITQIPVKTPTTTKIIINTIPSPTVKLQAITLSPTLAYDSNGFPDNADQVKVTVSDIAKTPSQYQNTNKNVVFTCEITSFAKNDQGDVAAANCADPSYMSLIVQVDTGNFDIKQINVGDTINIWGFVSGVGKGKNAYGAEVTETLVSGLGANDLTTGYNNTK